MFKAIAKLLVVFSVCGGMAALVGLTNCGGGDGGGGGGDGGDPSCPPQTSPALTCSPGVSPASPVITDFTVGAGWCVASGKWGTTGNLVGGVFAYNGPGRIDPLVPVAASVGGGIMELKGDVGQADYAGGGLAFDACVNTTTYSGVRFTLGGETAGCSVVFQVQTFSQQATSNRGGCNLDAGTGCYQFPKISVPVGEPTTIMWSQLEGTGMPATGAAIAAEIVGLQFQLEASGGTNCINVDLTIDDVQFVP
jgi:hypothetical protein